ncbi:hypothetical protein ACLPIF_19985, partial [Providencia sp. Me1]|uniref:hypothetical protein n=1 Tax=Providencia sp. Me1 TaxID=3392634 RepID=UPI003D2CDC78
NNDVKIDSDNFYKFIHEITIDNIIHPLTFNEENKLVSSGCKVISWLPYITNHYLSKSLNNKDKFISIDLATARFLGMKLSTLKNVGKISENLLQYQGDNDFSFRAKKLGYKVLIYTKSYCNLYDGDTGFKNTNIKSISILHKSFFSIRSANNIKYKFNFLCNHFNKIYSLLILSSMLLNCYIKTLISSKRKKT